ncbi:MAG: MFS transporter [Chitinophagaceae bacterium]
MPLLLSPARWIGGGGDQQSSSFSNKQIRVAVSVFFFCQGLCFSSWASRIPDIKSTLHLTDAALGSILLALPAGQLTAMPFSGKLVTHFGSKKILRICLLLYAICLTNMGLATQAWHLALALYFFGVCGNMCNISVNTQAIAAEKLFGRPIMTSFHGVWSTAGFTGAAIGLLMVGQRISPYVHFWIVTGIVFVAIAFSQRYLQPGRSSVKQEKKKFFSRPNGVLVQLGIIGFCSMASEGAMFDWSGVYFKQVVEAPEQLIVLGYASFMIMMATGRFVGDKLILQFGRKKMLRISGVLISSGLFISVLFPYLATATLGFLIVGLGVSSIVPMVYSSAGKIPNIPPGIALASVSSISFLGFLMGPPLIGYIAEISSLRYSFAVIGLLGFGIAVMVSKLKAIH